MVINFQNCPVKTDITGKNVEVVDIREAFANIVYLRMSGIAGLTLALKIYLSEGELNLEDNEIDMVRQCSLNYCIPAIVDAIESQLKTE